MSLLSEKLGKYQEPQYYKAKGVYPYFREIDSHQGTEVMMSGKKVLMFGSNAYTGLTYDQRIIDDSIEATKKYGTGCAGSRLLNGTLDIHVQLEKELAAFLGKDEALCFSTGFTVNEGVIPQLVGRGDYIICDDRDHASIVDGRRLSFATQLKYKHNDMEALEKELKKCEPNAIKLIVVDGQGDYQRNRLYNLYMGIPVSLDYYLGKRQTESFSLDLYCGRLIGETLVTSKDPTKPFGIGVLFPGTIDHLDNILNPWKLEVGLSFNTRHLGIIHGLRVFTNLLPEYKPGVTTDKFRSVGVEIKL